MGRSGRPARSNGRGGVGGHHKAFATTSSGPESAVRWVFNIEIWYHGPANFGNPPAALPVAARTDFTVSSSGKVSPAGAPGP